MNIFCYSNDVEECARILDDKRLNKMILETAQIMCSVVNILADMKLTEYKTTHASNPITLWALADDRHMRWLYQLGMAYGEELIYRKGCYHSSYAIIETLGEQFPVLTEHVDLDQSEFFNGARHKKLGLDFTHLPVFLAYREYYAARIPSDKREPVWTKRDKPSWL